jgi:hypothetical protein
VTKQERKFALYAVRKAHFRVGLGPKPKKRPKGFTKRIEREYDEALTALVELEAEVESLTARAWDEFDQPIGLNLDDL